MSLMACNSSIRVAPLTTRHDQRLAGARRPGASGRVSHSAAKGKRSRAQRRAAANDGNASRRAAMRPRCRRRAMRVQRIARADHLRAQRPLGRVQRARRSAPYPDLRHRGALADGSGRIMRGRAGSSIRHEKCTPVLSGATRALVLETMRAHSRRRPARSVPTAPEVARNRDSHYPRSASTATSITCPAFPNRRRSWRWSPARTATSTLFCREKNAEREIWDGFRYGPGRRARRSSASTRRIRSPRCRESCPSWRPTARRCSRRWACSDSWDKQITQLLNEVRNRARTGVSAPDEVVDVRGVARRDAPHQGRSRAER